ncbi:heavy metal translocating P-type ATPase [Candidatus Uabimicrobium amorphum]
MQLRRFTISTPCFHCGLPCLKDSVTKDEHHFCCHGCLFVFEILQGNSLHKYYELEKSPGKPATEKSKEEYTYLDDAKFLEHFLKFNEQQTAIACFYIPNIHCASCIWLLENLYRINAHIKKVDVNFSSHEVYITYDKQNIRLSEIAHLLSQLGYPPHLSLDHEQQNAQKNHDDLLRLGVAGFCFGNVMLLSFPEYLSSDVPKEFQRFFGYLNLLLTIPVFFYAAKEWLYSSWISLKQKNINLDIPIALGLIALLSTSAFDIISKRGPGYCDSLCGFVFFLLIGKFFQKKTFQNLSFDRDYKAYFPLSTLRIQDNDKCAVPVHELQVGDTIFVRHQELIPVDGKLQSDHAQIDYSFVTGESDLIAKDKGQDIFAGGRIVGKAASIQVEKQVEQSFLTSLWKNVQNKEKSAVQTLTNTISPFFTLTVISIALASFAYYWLYGKNIAMAWYTFSSVLIVACPCALALTSSFTHGAMIRLLEKHRIFLKSGDILEKLAKINNVVFDKTGTLTSTTPRISLIFGNIDEQQQQILANIVHQSIHPVSQTLAKTFPLLTPIHLTEFNEIPGKGIAAKYNSQDFFVGSVSWISSLLELPKGLPQKISQQSCVAFAVGNKLCCVFATENNFRRGWENIVSRIAQKHAVHLISGDSKRDLDIVGKVFPKNNIHFNLDPFQKVAYIEKLQKSADSKVLMIGDGLNDSGALIESDVGVAVIEENSHFSPASDIILAAEKISLLPKMFSLSRATLNITYASFAISCIYNSLGITLAISGKLTPVFVAVLMPVSSVTVMLFTTFSSRRLCKKILGDDKWE